MTIKDKTKAFKAYDIRGEIGVTLDAGMAYDIGRALVLDTRATSIAVGCDARPSSPELKAATISGIIDQGADAIDLGFTGTEETYFAAQYLPIDAAVEITASHNPIGDNGLKFILAGGAPLEGAQLKRIRDLVVAGHFPTAPQGVLSETSILHPYVDHLLSYIDPQVLAGMKIVTNAGNGMAGHVIDEIEARLAAMHITTHFVKIHHEPDASFPNGIPNPMIVENQQSTRNAVISNAANFGVAWDGDFDRCFLFDEHGAFIEGYYLVGLLSEAFLAREKGGRVVYDPRLIWNTIATAVRLGGSAVAAKTGHVFMKSKMREVDGVYGGEMSAHHYFRDFGYCDSGMIPWLLISQLLHDTGQGLADLVGAARAAYPCSGEINFMVSDAAAAITAVRAVFADQPHDVAHDDGLCMDFGTWRINIRQSNTEPLLRINVESRADEALMIKKTELVRGLLAGFVAQ